MKDFFSCSRFDLELDTAETLNNVNLDSTIRNITLGILKKGWGSKYEHLYEEGRFVVQLQDKFSKLNEIGDYLDAKSEMYEPDAFGYSCIVTIDKNTPSWMVDSTINMIKRHRIINKIYKTCIDKKTGGIGLVEIN